MSEPQTTPDQNSDNDARRNETPATGLPGQGEVPAGTTLEEDTICHDAVDPRTYGPNTPTKRDQLERRMERDQAPEGT